MENPVIKCQLQGGRESGRESRLEACSSYSNQAYLCTLFEPFEYCSFVNVMPSKQLILASISVYKSM